MWTPTGYRNQYSTRDSFEANMFIISPASLDYGDRRYVLEGKKFFTNLFLLFPEIGFTVKLDILIFVKEKPEVEGKDTIWNFIDKETGRVYAKVSYDLEEQADPNHLWANERKLVKEGTFKVEYI